MSEKEEVKRIVEKYHESMFELSENATMEEFQTVMKYVVKQTNGKQENTAEMEK